MSSKITISSSVERANNIFTKTPVNGSVTVNKGKTQRGVMNMSLSLASVDNCSVKSLSTGDECSVYGDGGSGKCILAKKTVLKAGGGSGTPYEQEILSFVGLQ